MLYLVGNNEYIRRTYKRYINLKNKHNEKNVLSINADEDKISNEEDYMITDVEQNGISCKTFKQL
ncbi:hypothetical protein PFAG_03058 [Plasmodium falciparum Santa Lucia]|uniref:Uncharacterized protein n=5 Tax=Plasmodium falciparum TaxID=5833 RepID=W4J2N2_PLAFP|nr:hypothetical protein PFFVO_03059 [Plasmodium falciparum Vietnam Oak-Knoll (FVO)]ETW42551.1 hypothetical protein PFNF135_03210 [Plasmodium falciparum NF135/5.C10]ETW56455.1 hypothetical protein PFUGPA_01626 [Plasmodium falciparum Palo Alto/Uganda]ETW61181.1 hypothetical protein PFMC_03045 [Plasmodium falciparum CAMP/Malaysia]EUT85366.1 hypothetical protein PFAG_03058 [Plasmodium falciparum Santa Lucia]